MIPILKESVRIRQEPDGVIFRNMEEGTYIFVSFLEGFILSFFDGTRTIEDVTNILKNLKNAPEEREIKRDINKLIEKREEFIEMIERPIKKGKVLTNPYDFLLNPDICKQPIRPHAPLSALIYVTRRCNLNCVYCFADAQYGSQRGSNHCDEMSLDQIKCIIDQIAELEIRNIVFTGGEATLRPDLPEIIRYSICHDLEVSVPTNACLIDDNLAQELKNLGITEIQAKLDASNPKTQDKLSRVKGSFKKLTRGIETLKKHSFKVTVVAVATSWNIEEIPEVVRICADLGVDTVIPRIYTPGIWALRGRGGAYLNPSPNSIVWLNEKIEELQKDYDGMEVLFRDYPSFQEKKESDVASCPGFTSDCTILENGLVVPCETLADFFSEFIMGDAKKERLIDIWNTEKAKRWALRESPKVGGPCLTCDEFQRCKGGCPWKSIVAYGTWSGDPSCVRTPNPTEIPFAVVP